jgi:hypothetical protein
VECHHQQRRGIIVYIEYQRVSLFVGIGSPPSPRASVSPPGTKGGGQYSLAGEGGGSRFGRLGEKAWHSVYSISSMSGIVWPY